MTMVELRCAKSLHCTFNPETLMVEVKCKTCSRDQQQPIYHRWQLTEIIAQYMRGDAVGICEPSSPRFVHWRVSGA